MPRYDSMTKIVNGQPMLYWLHNLAKALIASTDVGLRYNIVHRGKVDELIRLKGKVEEAIGVKLSADDMRWVFWRIKTSLPPAQQDGVKPYWVDRKSITEVEREQMHYAERDAIDANPIETETLPDSQKQRIVLQ